MSEDKIKTKPYNDIDLKKWQEYSHLHTGTLWDVSQPAAQLFERFTQKDDAFLDISFGSTASETEALSVGWLGSEPQEETVIDILCENSADDIIKGKIQNRVELMGQDNIQFLVLRPQYNDTTGTVEEFYDRLEVVAKNGYNLLEKGRFAALIIGDKYHRGELIPLGLECLKRMQDIGFTLKSVCVNNIRERGDKKTEGLWRYRALCGGFYTLEHEYIYIMQKK